MGCGICSGAREAGSEQEGYAEDSGQNELGNVVHGVFPLRVVTFLPTNTSVAYADSWQRVVAVYRVPSSKSSRLSKHRVYLYGEFAHHTQRILHRMTEVAESIWNGIPVSDVNQTNHGIA